MWRPWLPRWKGICRGWDTSGSLPSASLRQQLAGTDLSGIIPAAFDYAQAALGYTQAALDYIQVTLEHCKVVA